MAALELLTSLDPMLFPAALGPSRLLLLAWGRRPLFHCLNTMKQLINVCCQDFGGWQQLHQKVDVSRL
jgi:hypothetical protein